MASARARSAERGNPPRAGAEKRQREERLQELMKEFRETAADGIRVEMVDPETQLFTQTIFKLDLSKGSMSLQPAFSEEASWELVDIGTVMKGSELSRKVPEVSHISSRCLGIEFDSEMRIKVLHFQDTSMRDDFLACLKIVRMMASNLQGA